MESNWGNLSGGLVVAICGTKQCVDTAQGGTLKDSPQISRSFAIGRLKYHSPNSCVLRFVIVECEPLGNK